MYRLEHYSGAGAPTGPYQFDPEIAEASAPLAARAAAAPVIGGARHLAAYTPFKLLEGKDPVEAIVAIEFPDIDAARRWYGSAVYQAVKKYREGAADIELILVEGGIVADPEQRVPHTKGNVNKL